MEPGQSPAGSTSAGGVQPEPSVRVIAVIVLAALAAIAWTGVVSLALAEPDEARNAEIAREMLLGGDWVVPRLGGEVYLDKPPLLYWLSAVVLWARGLTDGNARLPVFFAAVLCVAIVFRFARRLWPGQVAWVAALILATSPLFFVLGQLLSMDILLALATTGGMACLWAGGRHAGWRLAAYGVTAIGFLAKGPVAGVFIWGPAVLYHLGRRDLRTIRSLLDWRGVALFLVICSPWFILTEGRQPGFSAYFIWHHHFERFVDPWVHREPFWFFLPVALVGMLPWSILWLCDVRAARAATTGLRGRPGSLYLFLYAATPLVVFSVSSSKLIPYLLPSLPPAAILLGMLYGSIIRRDGLTMFYRAGFVVAGTGATVLAAGTLFYVWSSHWRVPLVRPLLVAGGVGLLVAGVLTRSLARRGFVRGALSAFLAGVVGFLLVAEIGRATLAKNSRALLMSARRALPVGTEFAVYGNFLPAVDFYLNRTALLIAKGDQVGLRAFLGQEKDVALVVRAGQADAVRQFSISPLEVVSSERHHVVLAPSRPIPDTVDPAARAGEDMTKSR